MKNLDDLRIIGNENLILEMYIMQLVHVKSLDVKSENSNYSEIIESSKSQKKLVGKDTKEQNLDADFSSQVKNQLKNTDQVKTKPIKSLSSEIKKTSVEITNFKDLINLATRDKEIELRFDLERNVKLVSFKRGKIDISFNEKLNKDFIKNLTEKLLLWTGERWIISLSKNSEAKSVYEQNLQNRSNKLDEYEKSKTAKQLKDAFPDAELINIDEEDND